MKVPILVVTLPVGNSPEENIKVVKAAIGGRMAKERKIGKIVEANFGRQAIELAREKAGHQVALEENRQLHSTVENLTDMVERLDDQNTALTKTIGHLDALLHEIVERVSREAHLPYGNRIEEAIQKARQPEAVGPFLPTQTDSGYNLRKASEALSRLNRVTSLQKDFYNSRNPYYKDRVIPAEMVIAFLERLADLNKGNDVYGGLKVMFAQAWPVQTNGSRKSTKKQ